MLLLLLTTLAQAEIQTIWIEQSILDSESFPKSIRLGFLEQERDGALLFAIDDSDLWKLQNQRIPFQRHQENKNIPNGYRNTQDGIDLMTEFAEIHPDRVRLHTLGISHRGRPILGLQISDTEDPINAWKILGTHHGDELSASEVSLDFIQHIYDNIDSPEISEWLQTNELWIVPHVNPDGMEDVSRYNENWVDLNRNYSWEWTSQEFLPGDHAFSEPETQAIRILEEWNSFTGGLSLHSGASNISWVWNYSVTPTVDDSLVKMLAQDYADHCAQPDFWVVNGAEWYVTYGDTTDWAYGAQGSFDLTLEVSSDKRPPASQLDAISGYHIPAMWNFLQWEHWISAKVYDADTQEPIQAEWTLLEDGILDRGSISGRLSRLVESDGVWTVEISAAGYVPQIMTVEAGQPVGVHLEKAFSDSIDCQIQEAGELELSLNGNPSSVSLFKQGAEILQLEEQDDFWVGRSAELLSGVYDLQVNEEEWLPNAVVLVDRWEEQASTENNIWVIEDSLLSKVPSNVLPSVECVFQIKEGTIIGFSEQDQEPSTEPAEEPAIEPSTEEPSTEEPSKELGGEASDEPKIGAGGCQTAKNNDLPIWSMLLGLIFLRRKNQG